MQTFMAYPDFAQSARVLDDRRLNKQRVEAKQILMALDKGPGAPWFNRPATKMWAGYRNALAVYGATMCFEWSEVRGRNDHVGLLDRFLDLDYPEDAYRYPPWVGVEAFHSSHRANLLRKDPDWYGRFGWTEEPAAVPGYWWPTKEWY